MELNCSIPINANTLWEIDANYGGTPNWLALRAGLKNATPASNESVDTQSYFDGQGFGESAVIGAQHTMAFTLDRILSNPAQEFVLGLVPFLGCNRVTQIRGTSSDGRVKSGICTIANIVEPGGDAVAKGEWSFEAHFKGKPTYVPATSAPLLTAVVAAGSVAGSTSFTATPAVTNTLAYVLTNSVPTIPNALSYVSVFAYTSGANIPAVVGQSLNMLELDANGRVVKFATKVLASGDFPA